MLALVAALAVPGKAQVPAVVTQFDVTGFIQQATIDSPSDIFSGGTITVNNVKYIVPYYTILQMPAFALTWQELFAMAPAPYTGLQTGLAIQDLPKPKYNYEAHLVGNRLPDGRQIVGLMFLSQHSLHAGQGFITAVNFADGSVTIDGITRVRINDPIGRFSVGIPDAQNPDKRFTIDEDNPTIRASSSYPMCIPRSAADSLCPQKNRPLSPVDGVTRLGFFTMPATAATPTPANQPDPYLMAPFEVGDWVTYNGLLVDDPVSGTYVLAHTMIAEATILTAPGSLPAYTAIDVALQGVVSKNAAAGLEGAVRTRVEGWSTDAGGNTAENIYAVDVDACSGVESERLWNDHDPKTGAIIGGPFSIDIDSITAFGRWRFRPSARDESFLPGTRMIRARNTSLNAVDHRVILTPNGLMAGEYSAPDFEFIFAEAVPPGAGPQPPNNFENLPFLVSGEGPYNGGAPTGQISPWPSLIAPLTTTSCAAPPPPPPPAPPAGTPLPVANPDTLTITGTTLSFSAATLLANDTGTTLAVVGVSPISNLGGTITGTGPYLYTPKAGSTGADTFSYQIRDSFGQTALGFVTVNRSASITVPNVVGLTQAAAQSAITGAGLTNGAVTNANSATVPAGSVISQSPAAGSAAASGASVSLVVSLGPALVTVPNVVNQTQAAAQSAITAAGLTNGAATSANSATVPAGSVISQNPAGGSSVAPGSSVSLVISLGPALVTVPNVVNQTQAAAQGAITGAGLTNGAVTSANSATIAAGSVISQNPAAGTSVAPGTAVALVVSLGPAPVNVTVPNVVNLTQAAAQSAITAAGLTNGAVTNANSATVPAGSVISQSPAAGASVAPGTAVALTVSLGPSAAASPTLDGSVSSDGTGARTVTLSTTAAGDVLIALIGSDGPTTGANNQNITVSGAGLTWTRVQRAATSRGVAEIWTATAPALLTNAAITSTQSVTTVLGAPVNQSLMVFAFSNASAVGATTAASGVSTNATATLVTQAAGSLVFGVGNDFDRAVARTVGAGQAKLHEFLAPTGDTFWMQRLNAASTAAGQSITLNATAAGAADQWNLSIVEIKR